VSRFPRSVRGPASIVVPALLAVAVVAGAAVPAAPASASASTGLAQVATGGMFSCGRTGGGAALCWGSNDQGQLGDGSHDESPVPVQVAGLDHGVTRITAGDTFACAVTAARTVLCWGSNDQGQLGDGTTDPSSVPVPVADVSRAKAVSAGFSHACALLVGGKITCWGSNSAGQLGNGVSGLWGAPSKVARLGAKAVSVAAGGYHSCAVLETGAAKCWGENESGELGDGTTTDRRRPTQVSGLAKGVQRISAGQADTCAVTRKGAAKCWGLNESSQLGDGTVTRRTTPTQVYGLTSGVDSIAAGDTHTCAVTSTGAALCWGVNASGQVGDGTTSTRSQPVQVATLTGKVGGIDAGYAQTCSTLGAGRARCWGFNGYGQLGDGTTTSRSRPAEVQGF
jgi:alpha-tubulin suppressor-like RCC1 family protein